MKKQNIGLALILLGIILAIPVESGMWMIGVVLGIVGLIVVIANSSDK